MKEVKLIVGINLVILLAYSIAIYFYEVRINGGGFGYTVAMMLAVSAQSMTCLFAGIVLLLLKYKALSNAFAVAWLVIALVGFSLCIGGGKLADKSYIHPSSANQEHLL